MGTTDTTTPDAERGLEQLVAELDLKPGENDLFVGRRHGFPLGLKVIGPDELMVLLIQIRYPVDAESKSISGFSYGPEVKQMVAEKQVEISVEDKIAWLTFANAGSLLEDGSVPRVVDAVLAAFNQASLAGLPDKCHYCQEQNVESLTCVSGKVAQICYSCLEGKVDSHAVALNANSRGIAKAMVWGSVASLIGAVVWALIWIGHDYLFTLLHTREIIVPRLLWIAILGVVGLLVGGPVGFILKKIPNRGDMLAGAMGIIFGITSVILGEVFFVAWWIYAEFHVVSLSMAIRVLPNYWLDNPGFYLVEKLLVAIVCVVVVYTMARPEKRLVKV